MSRPDVKVTIQTYPEHDAAIEDIKVESHWNRRDRLVLTIRGEKYIVITSDVERAINAVQAVSR